MTNPTSNFGWQMPEPTDLVTDLPADFEVFGDAVDTDFQYLLGGTTGQVLSKTSNTNLDFAWVAATAGDITGVTAGTGISGGGTSGTVTVTNSMATAIDAKGDLVVGTGADTFSKLTVGANTYLLTADNAEATGLKWAAPASGGGMTLINSGGTALTSTGVTISSIPGTHKHLYISVKNAYNSAIDSLYVRLNGDTGSNYTYTYSEVRTTTFFGGGGTGTSFSIVTYLGTSSGAANEAYFDMWIPNYTDTNGVFMNSRSIGRSNYQVTNVNGIYANTAAITSVTIYPQSGTFSGGTAYVYGVS